MDNELKTNTPTEATTKVCPKCGRELQLSEFSKSSNSKDGYQHHCKDCQRMANKANKKRKKAINLLDYVVNSEQANLNPKLEGFTPRELLTELRARGYRGDLLWQVKVKL